jgi:hypothetical protein
MNRWTPSSILAQHTIHKPMVKQKRPTTNTRRYVESLRFEVWEELGQESSVREVFIQQQLSSKHQDGTF